MSSAMALTRRKIPPLTMVGVPPDAFAPVPYSGFTPSTTGGVTPYTFSLSAGSVPPGLIFVSSNGGVINDTGPLFGVDSTFYPFTTQVVDSASAVRSISAGITVYNTYLQFPASRSLVATSRGVYLSSSNGWYDSSPSNLLINFNGAIIFRSSPPFTAGAFITNALEFRATVTSGTADTANSNRTFGAWHLQTEPLQFYLTGAGTFTLESRHANQIGIGSSTTITVPA